MDVVLDHQAEVMFLRFLHYKVALSHLFHAVLLCGRKSHLRNEDYFLSSLGQNICVNYLELFWLGDLLFPFINLFNLYQYAFKGYNPTWFYLSCSNCSIFVGGASGGGTRALHAKPELYHRATTSPSPGHLLQFFFTLFFFNCSNLLQFLKKHFLTLWCYEVLQVHLLYFLS